VSIYKKLEDLNISLPELTQPVAEFVPYLRIGVLVFLAGHIAKTGGEAMDRPTRGGSYDRTG
jgi:hypothetical protein